jgi:two-component system response regulator AtoC
MARILVIDDDLSRCELLAEQLATRQFDVVTCQSAPEALELLEEGDFDAVITDLNLEGASGIDFCQRSRENRPGMPVIVITAFGDMDAAIRAIRAGASDFISKPIEFPILELALDRALRESHLRERIARLKQVEVPPVENFGGLIGTSRAMHVVYDLIRRVAATETTVLLSGESGTGKELVARALHELGGRTAARFVAINCAAMPGDLLESELFGHTRGAFTDAKEDRTGLFEQARHGTLLLDEIGEMPLEMQPKLLRVLQERSVRPVGGNESFPMTARIIAATNRDLEEEVEKRRFREDLFYRLNVVQIHIPPLRARGNDIVLLADHFLEKFAKRSGKPVSRFAPDARRKLLAYDWPGNVRQLENTIERAVALTQSPELQLQDLPDRVLEFNSANSLREDVDLEHTLTLAQVEYRQVGRALQKFGGNKTRAAKALGVDRRTLYRMLERVSDSRSPSAPPPSTDSESA